MQSHGEGGRRCCQGHGCEGGHPSAALCSGCSPRSLETLRLLTLARDLPLCPRTQSAHGCKRPGVPRHGGSGERAGSGQRWLGPTSARPDPASVPGPHGFSLQNWCIKRRSQSIYLQVLTDKHAPEHYRYGPVPLPLPGCVALGWPGGCQPPPQPCSAWCHQLPLPTPEVAASGPCSGLWPPDPPPFPPQGPGQRLAVRGVRPRLSLPQGLAHEPGAQVLGVVSPPACLPRAGRARFGGDPSQRGGCWGRTDRWRLDRRVDEEAETKQAMDLLQLGRVPPHPLPTHLDTPQLTLDPSWQQRHGPRGGCEDMGAGAAVAPGQHRGATSMSQPAVPRSPGPRPH